MVANQHSELVTTVRETLLHSQHSAEMVEGSPSFFDPALEALSSLEEQLEAAQKRLAWYEGLQGDMNDADFAMPYGTGGNLSELYPAHIHSSGEKGPNSESSPARASTERSGNWALVVPEDFDPASESDA